jgi:dolichyl-phosphate beta-glucosyltransferase
VLVVLAVLAAGAVGSRAHMQDEATATRTFLRNFLMHGFHLLCMLVVGPRIRDTQCGFKAFTREAARQIFPGQRLQRWSFDLEVIYLAQRARVPVREVGVNWEEKDGSKLKASSVVHMGFEVFLLLVCYRITGLWKPETPCVEEEGDLDGLKRRKKKKRV